jgi:hypothetical protein
MNFRKLGAIVVSVWCGLNILVAGAVTVQTLRGHTPILAMTVTDGGPLDPRLVGVIYAQAALANPLIVAFCALVLIVLWRCFARGEGWAFWALVAVLGPIQAFGFVSDRFLGNHNLTANLVSSVLLVVGLSLCDVGRRQNPKKEPYPPRNGEVSGTAGAPSGM